MEIDVPCWKEMGIKWTLSFLLCSHHVSELRWMISLIVKLSEKEIS